MAGSADGSVVIKIDLSSSDAEKELSRLKKKLLSLEEDLTVGKNKKDVLTQRLESYWKALEAAQSKVKLKGGKLITSPENIKLIGELQANITATEAAIEKQNAALQNTQMAIDGVKMRYEEVRALAEQTADISSQQYSRSIDAITQKLGRVQSVLHPIISTARNGISNIFHGLKSCAAQLGKMFIGSKSLSKSFGGVSMAVKRIAPALLAAEGIIGILRKAVNAYMQQNQQLANTLSSAWTGLGNILGPIIERMVNLLATVIAYFTKFFSLLGFTGKAATKQINSAGGAAKKETEELKKSLLSFDTLEILSDKKEESGGGGGGAAYIDLTDSKDVELPNWAKKIAEQFKAGEWAEAAKTLTSTLNDMIDKVDWNAVGEKLGHWLDNAMTFLSTAVTTFDWIGLGDKLSTAFNGIVRNVNWSNLGTLLWAKFKIALETLAGFITGLDVPALAEALSSIATGFFDSISKSIDSINWVEIGDQIISLVTNIKWKDIADSIWNALTSAFKAVLSAGLSILTELFSPYIEYMKKGGLEGWSAIAGGIITGLLDGIKNAVIGIGTWINDHIVQPFIDGFKNAFGIHSPSTVMKELGGYIIDGLLEGLKAAWTAVQEWIGNALESIKNKFLQIKDQIVAFFTGESIEEEIAVAIEDHYKYSENGHTGSSGKWAADISAEKAEVEEAVEDLVEDGIIGTAEDTLEANDPKQIGEAVTDGVADGLSTLDGKLAPWQQSYSALIQSAVADAQRGAREIQEAFNGITMPPIYGIGMTPGYNPRSRASFTPRTPRLASLPIPHLAKGTVIPPRAPFLAMLGDQRRGTNVETPVKVIEDAVANVVGSREMLAEMKEQNALMRDVVYMLANIDDAKIGKMANRYNRQIDRAYGR